MKEYCAAFKMKTKNGCEFIEYYPLEYKYSDLKGRPMYPMTAIVLQVSIFNSTSASIYTHGEFLGVIKSELIGK